MRAVASMLSVSLLSVSLLGCFPHNEKARTYAKYVEGGLIVAGIGAEVLANRNTGANCDMMSGQIGYNADCHSKNEIYGGVGLGMILVGLTGFIATISTAEDDKSDEVQPVIIKAQDQAKPEVKLPAGVTAPPPAATPSGSDAATPQKPAP
jgi:hypothetical protein